MGTRSTCGVRINGVEKIAYNQYDGYPSGIGSDILEELKKYFKDKKYKKRLVKLREKAENCRLVGMNDKPSDADKAMMIEAGAVDLSVSHQSYDDWYCLERNNQGSLIKRLDIGIIVDASNTGGAYYQYMLDLDAETFEFYYTLQDFRKTYSLKDFLKLESFDIEY